MALLENDAYLDRVREALTKAGIDLGTVLTTGIEQVGVDLVSVVVIDPVTKEPLYRALLDLPPVRITPPAEPPVGKTSPARVWVLMAADWESSEILDVYSSPEAAEAGLKKRHEEYLDYIRGYMGEDPNAADKAWLEQIKSQPDRGYYGVMDIYEWRVED